VTKTSELESELCSQVNNHDSSRITKAVNDLSNHPDQTKGN